MTESDNIRMRVASNQLTFTWLINRMRYRGVDTDKSELSAVLAGTRKGAKADSIIQCAGEILDYYERCFHNC